MTTPFVETLPQAFLAPPFLEAFVVKGLARRQTLFLTLEARRLLRDCFSHPFRHLWAERTEELMLGCF